MSTVLAAVDDSAAATPVITAALALAPLLGSEVEALHVGAGDGSTACQCAERMGVPYVRVDGEPLQGLLERARSGVTALVVGTRDQASASGPVGHLVLTLADRSPTPVLVVPPRCEPAARFQRVVVALEGEPRRAKPLRHAVNVVSGADLDLTVVHVDNEDNVPAFSDSAAHETAEFAHEYLARYWPLAPRARLALPIGSPADEILRVATDVHADLLVAGWPQGAGEEHGRVVRELLRRCSCPLLLVAVSAPVDGAVIDLARHEAVGSSP